MKSLDPPDSLHLLASQGWLELGNVREATVELKRIARGNQEHPDVLDVRWQILAHDKEWARCVELARAMIRSVPDRAPGWIHLSYALHELGETQSAFDNLVEVAGRFAREPIVYYNLACYCCCLKEEDEALNYLRRAMSVGHAAKIKSMALEDPDLKAMASDIRRL